MKKKRVTYGVYGMMEYQALIHVGKATMRVPFTDGSITAMGMNPASFSTKNLMVQMAIEGSQEYRTGLIKKVRSIELEEDEDISCTPITECAQKIEVPEPTARETSVNPEGLRKVKVASLADARDYLTEHFCYKASQVRSSAQVRAAAAENGIEFEIEE